MIEITTRRGAARAPRHPRERRARVSPRADKGHLGAALLSGRGWPAAPANAVAFLLAAQVNFALSATFTWRDRQGASPLWRRWLVFHGSIATMAVVNQLVFLAARTALPALAAAAAGIA